LPQTHEKNMTNLSNPGIPRTPGSKACHCANLVDVDMEDVGFEKK